MNDLGNFSFGRGLDGFDNGNERLLLSFSVAMSCSMQICVYDHCRNHNVWKVLLIAHMLPVLWREAMLIKIEVG